MINCHENLVEVYKKYIYFFSHHYTMKGLDEILFSVLLIMLHVNVHSTLHQRELNITTKSLVAI